MSKGIVNGKFSNYQFDFEIFLCLDFETFFLL